MVFIYILQCTDYNSVEKKWYIGKTVSSKFRIDTHFDSKGSEFTKNIHLKKYIKLFLNVINMMKINLLKNIWTNMVLIMFVVVVIVV